MKKDVYKFQLTKLKVHGVFFFSKKLTRNNALHVFIDVTQFFLMQREIRYDIPKSLLYK